MSSRERNQALGQFEPPGTYGLCWKDLPEPNPDYLKCTLLIGHAGHCRCQDVEDDYDPTVVPEQKP